MLAKFENENVQKILTLPADNDQTWKTDLSKLINGDVTLDRKTAGENSVKAFQRLLIFLGYSTSFRGAYSIDGDFGRGTNRGLAQFKLEHNLRTNYTRKTICYPCKASNAHLKIKAIPDVKLTLPSLSKMIDIVHQTIDSGQMMCGNLNDAIFHLNNTHERNLLTCRKILDRYGKMAQEAVKIIKQEKNIEIQAEWILAIIRQETGGVIRPRFEQHLLTEYNKKFPEVDLTEVRMRATSFGLGQILGVNYKMVGLSSAQAMYQSAPKDQLVQIGRFLIKRSVKTREVVKKKRPGDADFRTLARFYNGPKYEDHHYHESLARWFKEFQTLLK